MKRYIDKDKLYDSIKENVGAYWSEGEEVKEECLNEVSWATEEEVSELVMCENCIYCKFKCFLTIHFYHSVMRSIFVKN